MTRILNLVFAIGSFSALFALLPLQAQQTAVRDQDAARFEAVSIRRHQPDSPTGYREYPGGRIVSQGQKTITPIARAYGLRATRVIGGPDWIRSDPNTIETAASGTPDDARLRAMLQQLFAERYKLVVHTERRDMPSYVLTVARAGRLGPDLEPRVPACERGKPVAPETIAITMRASLSAMACGSPVIGQEVLAGVGMTMPDRARRIESVWLNEPVIDRTGLTGQYDVLLNVVNQWTNNPLKAEADAPDAARLPVALEDQLGLKLEPAARAGGRRGDRPDRAAVRELSFSRRSGN